MTNCIINGNIVLIGFCALISQDYAKNGFFLRLVTLCREAFWWTWLPLVFHSGLTDIWKKRRVFANLKKTG